MVFLAGLNLPCLETVEECIGYITECRDIHVWCIEVIENGTDPDFEIYSGPVEWHVMWIERYNKTLDVLMGYRNLLNLLSVQS